MKTLVMIFSLLCLGVGWTGAQEDPLTNIVLYPICDRGWQLYNFNAFEVTLDWYYQTENTDSPNAEDWTYPMRKGGRLNVPAGSQEEPSVTDFYAPARLDINIALHPSHSMPGGSGYGHEETPCPDDFVPRVTVKTAEDEPAATCVDVLYSAGLRPGDIPYSGPAAFAVRLGSLELPVATLREDGQLGAVFCSDQWLEGLVYEGFVDGDRAVAFQSGAFPAVTIFWHDASRLRVEGP